MIDEPGDPPMNVPLPCHGASVPRGLNGTSAGRGRFGRMFPCLPVRDLSEAALRQLMEHLRDPDIGDPDPSVPGFNSAISAGYTYLAQFIDHDLTFDPSSLRERLDDPDGRVNFRTPRLDLDSVYGSGPSDQPFLYDWEGDNPGVKFLVDQRLDVEGAPYDDLQRNKQCRAMIGDPRNDEHLIIAQLHLLVIQFHNSVVDHLCGCTRFAGATLFREARRIVRWHYQWIVTHDFLRRIVGKTLAGEILTNPAELRCFRWEGEPFMPVEFSGAAYRFGHSMVRPGYFMKEEDTAEIPILPLLEGEPDLHGFRALAPEFVIDWRRFFKLGRLPQRLLNPPRPGFPQPSARMDAVISKRLFDLPANVGTDGEPELALLNLRRAQALRLPAGPDVARAMGERPLDATELKLDRPPFDAQVAAELLDAAPLWYYILCEASEAQGGARLGPVGGRIVAEVLVGLLEADPGSYASRSPAWLPELEGEEQGDFTMADLIRFTHPKYVTA